MNASAASTPSRPRGPADAETLQLIEDLKSLSADVLGRGIERMFDGADDMLFEMARRSSNNKDQRLYFDTMRVVRLGRPKIGKIFRGEIAEGFVPEADRRAKQPAEEITFENLSLQDSRALEESIAVSTMASKAENLYGHVLFELNRRFEWLIAERNAPIAPTALAPATISDAFRRSAEALDVEFDIELVIFKLFDRLVISDLGELYTRVLRFLDEHGVKPAAIGGGGSVARSGGYAGPAGGGTPGSGPAPGDTGAGAATAAVPQGYGFAQPPMMDAATLNALRALSGAGMSVAPVSAAPNYYGDAQLGADLAAAASGQIVAGWEAPRAYAYVQRAGAVGQMFNELMQDPTLPAPLKPRFDQLRFSVIKSALRDASFFADRQHPVRGLMNELTTLAASARASGLEALRRIEELVGQIQGQFDVAAEDVRAHSNALPSPVDEKTLEQFFAQQKEDARQRRQSIIERTRRVVAEELQLQTLSRKVPDGTWPLLNSGWAPLAALRLLKLGADSDGWREALDVLRRILESIDPRRPAARGEENLRALSEHLESRLREIGMIEDRIHALLRSWRESLVEVEAVAPAPVPSLPPLTLPRSTAATETPAPTLESADTTLVDDTPPDETPVSTLADTTALLDEIPFDVTGETPDTAEAEEPPIAAAASEPSAPVDQPVPAAIDAPDAVTLLDLLMVLSSWFRVYDHDRGQNRWLKVVGHHPGDGTVTFAEFNGQNRLQVRTQVFLDDLVAGRAEPIDLGPAARRSLDAYLGARREAALTAARAA